MNRNTVLVFGISGVVVLMAIALIMGKNGALLASAFSAIGAMVGFAFGRLGDSPAAKAGTKIGAALLLGLTVAGCAGGIPVKVEVCVMHETYGKICASYVDGAVEIRADAELPPELTASIEEQIRKLAGK